MIKFTIPIEPRTKKNSGNIVDLGKRCACCKRGKLSILLPSTLYKKYEKESKVFIPKVETIDYPVNIKYLFYKSTNVRCDLNGLFQAADDILVKYKVIKDDNRFIVAGHDGSRVLLDKDNPRTEIEITPME